ncbi:LacI family DNA-binding transcriptional regulator, partial [Conexibacter sp. JD483]|uniref:LacI family DNA-binding transcriptional regulator n=3 Tax=Conexibacter TaxID=191494 RepID=UPI002870806D
MRPATSHDVARLAGVSQPTVSRALRDDPRVSRDTIARVRAAAASLGYVPSSRGRSLSTRATGQVAVVVGELDNPFYMEALEHLYGRLEADGLRLVALTDPPERSSLTVERLLDGAVDGAIVMTTLLGSDLPGQLAARGLPTVLLNRAIDDELVDTVECDNRQGAGLAAAELLALGHREIAAIFGPATTSTGRDREAAFREVLAAGGVPLAEARIRRGPFTHEFGRQALGELLAGAPADARRGDGAAR